MEGSIVLVCTTLKERIHNWLIGLPVMTHAKSDLIPKPYHPVTRWLHAALVLGVVFQLTCAVLMTHPEHADGGHAVAIAHAESVVEEMHHSKHEADKLGESFMAAHRTGGLLVALIVLVNLIWAIVARGAPRKRQIAVLFSTLHWREAWLILRRLCLMIAGKGGLPKSGNSLSLIVEMLGMLTMTAMAVSGGVIWRIWAGSGNTVTEQAETWMAVHGVIATLLFLYLAGHVSMALLHMRSGDLVFERIFPVTLKK